jgi:hypothetical protein
MRLPVRRQTHRVAPSIPLSDRLDKASHPLLAMSALVVMGHQLAKY